MRKMIIAFLLPLGLGACDMGMEPEVRTQAPDFPLRASWSATAVPIGTETVRADLSVKQFQGSRLEATVALKGGLPNGVYQWRIYRGDCSVNTPAASNTSPTGLLLFATAQSYPDITTDGTGTGTVTRTVAGVLDSLTAYSVRIRLAQTSTTWNGTNPLACGNLQPS